MSAQSSANALSGISLVLPVTPNEPEVRTAMRVRKRNGSFEPVDVNKIVRAVARCCVGLNEVDAMRVATKTISGVYDGATTKELDSLSIQTAALLTAEYPEYSKLAARLLATFIDKEVANQEIHSFSQSIAMGQRNGLIDETMAAFVADNARKLNSAIDRTSNDLFDVFGLRTLYDRYLLRHPETRAVIETPQYFFLRIACGIFQRVPDALDFYRLISSLDYLPSSPTLFNAGTRRPQLSSCFLLDSPLDQLDAIYAKYTDVALLSKYAGGIGIAYHRGPLSWIVNSGYQRQVQRHYDLAEDAGFIRRYGKSGRQTQRRVLCLSANMACRPRRVPRTP